MSKNVPVGYKLTEVGVIPEDWDVCKLGSCLLTPPDYGINAPAVIFSDRLPTYIRITDITEEGRFSPDPPVSVNQTNSSNYYLKEGDLVFARTGASVGKSYLYDIKDGELVFAGFLIRVHPDSKKLIPDYLSAYLTTGTYWNWIRLMSMRSGQPGINGNEYSQLPIPLPQISEQRSIALVLSDTDALITSLDKLIAKKRDIKQAAMQQLLTGKQRLEGCDDSSGKFKQTEIGLIPEDWEVMSLCDLTTDIGDGIHSTPQYAKLSKFYFINGNNLLNGKISITDNTMCVSEDEYLRLKKRLNNQTILLSINGTIGNLAFFNDEDIVLGKSAAYIIINPLINKNYVFYSLMTIATSRYFESELTGTTIRNLSLATLRNTPISLPKYMEEQQAIAKVLSDIDSEISALEQRRDKTKALKQAMMQELLTGKTRLKS